MKRGVCMKKIVVCLLICTGFFCFAMFYSDSLQNKQEEKIKQVSYKEDIRPSNHKKFVYYKLNDKTLEENQLQGVIEGYYDVYVQYKDQKSKFFDGSREIIKNGQDYFLKLKAAPIMQENNSDEKTISLISSKEEYMKLKVAESIEGFALILIKSDKTSVSSL